MAILSKPTKDIRNICLIGHGGNGKTSLAEAMLYLAKEQDRLGKIVEGNTACDYDAEEIKRKFSVSAALAPLTWKDKKINIIDTPGYLDFVGEVMQGLRVADCALIVMDAKTGIDVGCELAWDNATEAAVPKAFFINKMDDENANFFSAIEKMRDKFGITVCPISMPLVENHKLLGFADLITKKGYEFASDGSSKEISIPASYNDQIDKVRAMLVESLAETSDELMEKFFAEEEFTEEEMHTALHSGITSGIISPVMAGSATTLAGVIPLLNIISASFPSPLDKKNELNTQGESIEIKVDGPVSIFVFKTIVDPFVGKMSFFKVMSGTLKRDTLLNNLTNGGQEKFAHIYVIKGKKQTETDELSCGDVGVTTKLVNTNTNDTLTVSGNTKYAIITYPKPFLCMAAMPKAKGDEDKISTGINRLLEEDLTLKYENNAETKQMLLFGLGEQHLDVILSKFKTRFGTSIDLVPAKVAYRETIKKSVEAEGKHKKQSGGHGQYGHVRIKFSPGEEPGLVFTESVVGGAVPKNFYPAVEKGLLECMQRGVLAGFPVVHLKANLYDGSYHDVDSSEMSFKLAAALAFKEGLKKANPIILEPVGSLQVFIPDDYMGDVIGDVNKRRGKVLGMNPSSKKGISLVEAEVPTSEMSNYTISLRAMTQGRGKFTFRFLRYEEAPAQVAQKVIEEAKKDIEEE